MRGSSTEISRSATARTARLQGAVSMFGFLKKLFDLGDPLIEVAHAGDPVLFAETFRESEIIIVSTPIDQSLDPATFKQEELLELLETAAHASAESEDVRPFILQTEDHQLLPVFTSMEAAEAFVAAYVQKIDRVIPFLTVSLGGVALIPALKPSLRVVLNPGSPTEYELPDAFVSELRKGH